MGLCLSGSEFGGDMGVHFGETDLDFIIAKRRRLDRKFIGSKFLDDKVFRKRVGLTSKRPIRSWKFIFRW